MPNAAYTAGLIGRREQAAVIDRLLASLETGSGGMMVVAGEAGVGKTRLIEALTEMASERDLGVLLGRCIQFGESMLPVAPVVDFLAELERQLAADELEQILGPAEQELAGLMPSRSATALDGETLEASRLVELVHGVITRLAQRGPLVLVIEDLHWADRTTRDLVGLLAMALRREPVLLVVSYRSDDLHRRHPLLPTLAEIQRAAHPERLDLEPFDPETTAEFLTARRGEPLDPTTVSRMHRRSGGNAFYLEELVAAAVTGSPIPMTLREVVLSRAIDLDEDSVALLRVASVAGAHVDEELIGEVTGLGKPAMNRSLHSLVDTYFLVEQQGRFRFRHELTREVFSDELLPGERADLHAAIAAALMRSWPTRLGEIAHHWYQAGNQPEALRASVEAGESANQAGATAEALFHFERALELWDRVAVAGHSLNVTHPQLLLLAAETANQVSDFRRAVELARLACAELADADNITRARAQMKLMTWLWDSGEPGLDEASALAFELIENEPPSAEVAQILGRVGRTDMTRGKMELSFERCQMALDMAIDAGDRSTEAAMLDSIALYHIASHKSGATELLRQSLALALEVDDTVEANRSFVNLSEHLHFEGKHEEAIAVARAGLRHAEEHGFRAGVAAMLCENESRCLESLGRWDELEPLYEEVLSWRPLDLDVPAPTGLSVLERVMVKRGETDRARPLLEHDRDAVLTGYYCGTVSVIVGGLLELDLIEHHEPDRELVEKSIQLVCHSHARELIDVMIVALRCEADAAIAAGYRGDQEAVERAREAAGRWLDEVERLVLGQARATLDEEHLTYVDQCRAEYRRACGDHDAEAWADIVERLSRYIPPWPIAYAKWRLAEALLMGGGVHGQQRAAAEKDLSEAHSIALELRAKPLVADIEHLATRGRISLATSTPEPIPAAPESVPFDLTPREVEVLRLVAEGYSNGRIGQELFINTKTASVHVSNILRKLGAANRIEAAAMAHQAGDAFD